jgi:prepilin-type N-terminal cleavage/methylation domain-containing protein
MWQATKKGFTLIELMVVISVIVILVAILYPSVASAILSARAAQVQTRITELGNGCTQYRGDNNYYPGQSTTDMTELGRNSQAGTTTGSQLLAEALFLDFSDMNWDNNNASPNKPNTNLTASTASSLNRSYWHWKSLYAPLNWGVLNTTGMGATTPKCDLMTSAPSDTNVALKPYCVADQFTSNFLPILYFPADLSQTTTSQFVENDNSFYYNFTGSTVFALTSNPAPNNFGWMAANSAFSTDFTTFISDIRFGNSNVPYHSGEFLLIGAGKDRMYGSAYTLKNWSN